MKFNVITLFPDMVKDALSFGVIGKAIEAGLLEISCVNPRDFAANKHNRVDDKPFGGGAGMVMMYDPLCRAVEAIRSQGGGTHVVYMSPQGQQLKQSQCNQWAGEAELTLVCGRYEGIDQRFIDQYVDQEISIGDYVISGGELAAMVMIDGLSRLLPGVLGHQQSAEQDSFAEGLLDCPHYTRPEVYGEDVVPEVLLSGNHGAIRRWRLKQALGRTFVRRPDLLESRELSDEENTLLAEYLRERND